MIDELPKKILEARPLTGAEDFIEVMMKINEEGKGFLRVMAFTAVDCFQMILQTLGGMRDSSVLYWMECQRFLEQVRIVHPVCSGGNCENVISTPQDVGTIVLFHAHTDSPTGAITAGICKQCWTEKCQEDKHKAIDLFMAYMGRLMPGGVEHVANAEDLSPARTLN